MSNSKIGITRPSVGLVHPFKIDIGKNGKKADGTPQYTLSVNYHSRLFTGFSKTEKYLQWVKIPITGLDFIQEVPSSFPGENYYCVLEIKVEDLQAKEAKIVWVSDDKSVDELQPVEFQSSTDLKQIKAKIIIGVLVWDDEAVSGLPGGDDAAINTVYIDQFINTNLIMTNMVANGVPIIYPVPFSGGRLNF